VYRRWWARMGHAEEEPFRATFKIVSHARHDSHLRRVSGGGPHRHFASGRGAGAAVVGRFENDVELARGGLCGQIPGSSARGDSDSPLDSGDFPSRWGVPHAIPAFVGIIVAARREGKRAVFHQFGGGSDKLFLLENAVADRFV